jgi:hypothetical protein
MAGATPYVHPQEIYPQEIYPQPGPGSYHGGLGLNGMGMASPYLQLVDSPSTATDLEHESAYHDPIFPHHISTHSQSLSSTETTSSEIYNHHGRDPSSTRAEPRLFKADTWVAHT